MQLTYLLDATGDQNTISTVNPLHDDTATIARPGTFHLGKHPLISANLGRFMKVDAVINADHHAEARPALPLGNAGAHAFKLAEVLDLATLRRRQGGDVLWRKGKAPEAVNARDGAYKVAVGHVGEGLEVGLGPPGGGDLSPGAQPLATLAVLGAGRLVAGAEDLDAVALEGPRPRPLGLAVPVVGGGHDALGERGGVAHLLVAAGALAHEADGRGEDAPALLPRLHGARGKGPAVAHALHVEQDGHLGVARQQEVAVARVHEVLVGHGALRRRETLRDDGAAVDASRAGRMPRLASVGEDVLGMLAAL